MVVEADGGLKDAATWPRSREVSIVSRFECASSIHFNRKANQLLSTPPVYWERGERPRRRRKNKSALQKWKDVC